MKVWIVTDAKGDIYGVVRSEAAAEDLCQELQHDPVNDGKEFYYDSYKVE